jgi:predicted PurR-regulated permease PerM
VNGSLGGGLGSSPMPETPGQTAKRAAAAFAVVLAMSGGVLFFWEVRRIVLWVVVGVMLAMTLEPGVAWLTRRGLRRWQAAGLLTLLVLIAVIGIIVGLAVPAVTQSRQLIHSLPGYARDMFKPGSPLHPLDVRFHITERIKTITPKDVLDVISGAHTSIIHVFTKMLSFLAALVTTFTFAVMILIEGDRSWKAILRPLNEQHRADMGRLGSAIARAVGGYVRGNLLISVIAAAAAYPALLILHVPYPVPLALAVGVLDIVPLVGATIGAALCIVVALTQGWVIALILAGYFVVYQQVENNFIQIVVYSRTIAMSPLTVLVAALMGATLGGIVGVLIAIPVASALMIVATEMLERREARAAGGGGAAAEPAGEGEPAAGSEATGA